MLRRGEASGRAGVLKLGLEARVCVLLGCNLLPAHLIGPRVLVRLQVCACARVCKCAPVSVCACVCSCVCRCMQVSAAVRKAHRDWKRLPARGDDRLLRGQNQMT